MGGRRRKDVNQFIGTDGSGLGWLGAKLLTFQPLAAAIGPGHACLSNLLRHADHLRHLGHRVHADDVRAGEDRGGDGGGRAPVALGRGPAADRRRAGTTCATARRAPDGRAPPRIPAVVPAHHNCAPAVWQTRRPGSTISRSIGTPASVARWMLLAQLADHLRDDVVVDRLGVHRRSSGRACASGPARRRVSATARASAGSCRRPLTSLTIAAPGGDRRPRHLGSCRCRSRSARAGARRAPSSDRQRRAPAPRPRTPARRRDASTRRRCRSGRRRRPPCAAPRRRRAAGSSRATRLGERIRA